MREIVWKRAKERASRSQYSLEGICESGGVEQVPFYFMVLRFHASFQTLADRGGERLLTLVIEMLGEPQNGPDVVKGGACGGEVGELAEELDIHGAMMSVVWDGESFNRKEVISTFKESLDGCLEVSSE